MVVMALKLKHNVEEQEMHIVEVWLPGEIWVISLARVVSVVILCIS